MEEEVWTCEKIGEVGTIVGTSVSESTSAGNEAPWLTVTGAEYSRLM